MYLHRAVVANVGVVAERATVLVLGAVIEATPDPVGGCPYHLGVVADLSKIISGRSICEEVLL